MIHHQKMVNTLWAAKKVARNREPDREMAEKRTKNGLPIEIHKERNYELAALEMKKKVNFSTKLSINSISCVSTR